MLLSDYCSEINTNGITKKKKLSNTNYWLNHGSPAFAQAAFHKDFAKELKGFSTSKVNFKIR